MVAILVCCPAFGLGRVERDILYQVSTLDALMAGLYDGVQSIGELSRHGDFGLGTFDALDGEMVVLDGRFYQVRFDGTTTRVNKRFTTPFACVTFFDKDLTIPLTVPHDWGRIQGVLDGALSSRNAFHAIRIDGTFLFVKTRSVPRQEKPYTRKLAEIAAEQSVFEMRNITGTIVGFFCPYYSKGANLPGFHLHFISQDRTQGGHVLEASLLHGTLFVDETLGFQMSLPSTDSFRRLVIQEADKEAVSVVERGK